MSGTAMIRPIVPIPVQRPAPWHGDWLAVLVALRISRSTSRITSKFSRKALPWVTDVTFCRDRLGRIAQAVLSAASASVRSIRAPVAAFAEVFANTSTCRSPGWRSAAPRRSDHPQVELRAGTGTGSLSSEALATSTGIS